MNRKLWAFQARFAPYLFVLPFVAVFLAFEFIPLVRSVVLSFHSSVGPRHERFVGLSNYQFLLGDRRFWGAVANTVAFTLAFLIVQIPSSLFIAMLLNSPVLRLRSLFRFAFFSTYLVGPVFVAVLFSSVLDQRRGLLNRVLAFIGMTGPNWLNDPKFVMVSVLIAALWLSIGFGTVYLLAALQSVDEELYDAAEVDGAGRWSRFWHITLPGIRPVLLFLILVGTIGSLQLFELPYVLFNGPGPGGRAITIVMYLFLAFFTGDLGFASAVGWILVILILIVSLTMVRGTRALKEEP